MDYFSSIMLRLRGAVSKLVSKKDNTGTENFSALLETEKRGGKEMAEGHEKSFFGQWDEKRVEKSFGEQDLQGGHTKKISSYPRRAHGLAARRTHAVKKWKKSGKAGHERLVRLEGKVAEIARKHGIEKKSAIRASRISTSEAIDSLGHLPSIDEAEKKAEVRLAIQDKKEKEMLLKTSGGKTVPGFVGAENAGSGKTQLVLGEEKSPESRQHETQGGKVAGKDIILEEANRKEAVEIVEATGMLRLVTDFDRLLTYIKEYGKADYTQMARDLEMPLNRVDDCCAILEEEKQIEIVYPPIGPPFARRIGYSEKEDTGQNSAGKMLGTGLFARFAKKTT